MDSKPDRSTAATLPLAGRTILVTRPALRAREITRLLEAEGARVLCIPLIDILPPERWEACDAAIGSLVQYDAVIVTSANAARGFFTRLKERSPRLPEDRSPVPVYAVGEKTRDAVERFGVPCRTFEGVESSRQLAQQLMTHHAMPSRFLFPRGNLTRPDLPDALTTASHQVDEVEVYRTVPSATSERIKDMYSRSEDGIDAVTFFSPSAVDVFSDILGRTFRPGCAIAVIGSTTAEAAVRRGLPISIMADHPSAGALAAAVLRFFTTLKDTRDLPTDRQ